MVYAILTGIDVFITTMQLCCLHELDLDVDWPEYGLSRDLETDGVTVHIIGICF